jgi:hypothetical protein
MMVKIELQKVSCGTELKHCARRYSFDDSCKMCYLGWQESLKQLAKLVEPEIPEG